MQYNIKDRAIEIRTLRLSDIPFAMKLKTAAGWNQLARDWEFLIKMGGAGNFLAAYNSAKAGTATTLTYQNRFSWIGMVLVDPEFRGKGIGSSLLNESIQYAENIGTVRLDATPQGEKLYKTMDFVAERELLRLERKETKPMNQIPDQNCRQITAESLKKVIEKDSEIFGADRENVLRYLYHNSPDYAFIYVNNNNKITGYCFGRAGSTFEHIGPIVADSVDGAKNLMLSAMAACFDNQMIVDVFTENDEWVSFLKKVDFQIQRPFTRMYRGRLDYPGIPELQFAAAGPELG